MQDVKYQLIGEPSENNAPDLLREPIILALIILKNKYEDKSSQVQMPIDEKEQYLKSKGIKIENIQ